MRKLRWYDWLGGMVLWSGLSLMLTVAFVESGAPEEVIIPVFLTTWAVGVVAARVWWLRRPEEAAEEGKPRDGLTTGEMTAQRLAEMEARVYELEERLDLAERMLLQAESRQHLPAGKGMPGE